MKAQELARTAAVAEAGNSAHVGEHLDSSVVDDRLDIFLFESLVPGYPQWRWVVSIATLPGEDPTICDVALLPGPDALLAPEWIPWEKRVQPGDLQVGDILPTHADDPRMVPGYASLPSEEELDLAQLWELGLGRARVLSAEGRDAIAKRWYRSDQGPRSPIATQAPGRCAACAFFLPIAGSLRAVFGVCGNEYAPDDARVVSVDHGCGAHSQALVID